MKTSTERHLSRWIPTIVAILGVAVGIGASINRIDAHVDDTVVHMSYEEKIKAFVPRNEVENMIQLLHDSIQMTIQFAKDAEARTEQDIQRIEEKLDRIEEILLSN